LQWLTLPLASRFLSNDSEIKNTYFTISFDKKKGVINVYRSKGVSLLSGGTVCANSNIGKHSIASCTYKHTHHLTTFSDALGQGKKNYNSFKRLTQEN
jgi:hypothetical protein